MEPGPCLSSSGPLPCRGDVGARRGAVLRTVRIRAALALALLCWIWVALFQVRVRVEGDGQLTLFFLRIGQGDAAAIRTPKGHWILVGRGTSGRGTASGPARGGAVSPSHGARALDGGRLRTRTRITWGRGKRPRSDFRPAGSSSPAFRFAIRSTSRCSIGRRDGAAWHPAVAASRGRSTAPLHHRPPDTTWAGWGEDLNEDSVVLLVEYGRFRAVFSGDAGCRLKRGSAADRARSTCSRPATTDRRRRPATPGSAS
jgi:competence protein ComEC